MSRVSENQLTDYLVENQVRLYRLAYSYLRNQEDALDAVQTSICKAIEKQSSLRSAETLPTWTRRILINTCMDMLRQRSRVIYMEDEELNVGTHEDVYPSDSSLTDQINDLPTEIATVIKLRFFEELSLKEISEITTTNLNTVKTRLYAGLKKLHISLEGEHVL